MRRWILNIHLAIGLVAGVFITLLGITGAILAFEPQLDRLSHRDLSYVKPGGRTLSLVQVESVISEKYPGEGIVAYLPPTETDSPIQVILARGIVSVNQYSGEILGVRIRGQSSLGTVRELHRRLAMGTPGPFLLKWSSLAAVLSLLSGLYLWWPVKRMRIGGRWWSARFWCDLHSFRRIFLALARLGSCHHRNRDRIRGSGLSIDRQRESSPLRREGPGCPCAKTGCGSADQSRSGGRNCERAAAGKCALSCADASIWRLLRGCFGVSSEPRRRRRNLISLDPASGKVVSAHFSSDLSFRVRLLAANGAIHDGSIWGMPSRIVAALASMLLPLQAATGLLIWLRRKGIFRTR